MNSIQKMLSEALSQTGVELSASTDAIAQLTALRAAELAVLVGQPGYDQAVIATRDEIALASGLALVGDADAATGRVLSLIQGGLLMLAGAPA